MKNKIVNKFKHIDRFGEQVQFKVNGSDTYKSVFGALISLGIFATVGAYGINKFFIMKARGDTTY